ncbi:MAG TPA: xanthine dehydrogenase family protein subunit M [Candidatus Bathyarchaeia archaeon]|nr:xanthine dehydrogenase family protein subunit M [Candidatus Bathyarchaeia archaeon]
MREFDYERPDNLDSALELLGNLRDKARVIAGGTDLLPLLREDMLNPTHIVDIGRLPELNFIRKEEGLIRIGAATNMRSIEQSDIVRRKIPMFADAAQLVGEIGVRNLATLGGNLANASPAGDTAPPLLVLDASVTIRNRKTERTIRLVDFFVHVKKTILQPDELLTEIKIPIPPQHSGGAFLRLAKRGGNIISIVSAAAFMSLENDLCKTVRIAMGSVAPTPIRIPTAETILEGSEPTETKIREAAEKIKEAIKPISDVRASAGYRKETSVTLVRRALEQAYMQTKGTRT